MALLVISVCLALLSVNPSLAYNYPPFHSAYKPSGRSAYWTLPRRYPNLQSSSKAVGSMNAEYLGDGHSYGTVKTHASSHGPSHNEQGEPHSNANSYSGAFDRYLDSSQYSDSGIYYRDSTVRPNVLAHQSNYGTVEGYDYVEGVINAQGETTAKPYLALAKNYMDGYSRSPIYGRFDMYGKSSSVL